ncbi:MAG: alcohol dehydrogenase catalytic domain-containing protein [Acidimicrobiia bacterium]|nr:alcohol dehydrogenase catalytic domain-containing protein [Acidimicrobiia bacterium]
MRAWQLHDTNGPDSYQLDSIDPPVPGPGEVRVAMRIAALNHLDLWVSKGLPKPHHFPHIAGADGAGVIDAVGDGVTGVAEGDEVTINPSLSCGRCSSCLAGEIVFCRSFGILGEHHSGTLAEQVVVPARNVIARPDVDWPVAGSYGLAFGTAYRMLRRARLQAGETLLVVGIGGGVAAAAFELGQAMGADVMVTSRSESKRAWAMEHGAVAAVDSSDAFSKELPAKADVVVESVGPATFDQSIRSTSPGGRIAVCGSTSGPKVGLTVPVLFFKQIEILGSTMFTHGEFAEVTSLVASGKVQPQVDQVFGFDQLPQALTRLEAGEQLGKVALRF